MSRLEELQCFAQTWLGRSLTPDDGIEVDPSWVMPAALREIYQTLGAVTAFTQAHNALLPPQALVSEEGYCIFYDENQWVVRWAFREEDRDVEDPMVFQGTTLEEGYEWYSENMPLSAWIRVMTFWQLVNGGYAFCAYASGVAGATTKVESHFPQVGGHVDGSTRFYGTPGRLICLAGPAEVPSVWASGATENALADLSSILDFEWDYSCLDE